MSTPRDEPSANSGAAEHTSRFARIGITRRSSIAALALVPVGLMPRASHAETGATEQHQRSDSASVTSAHGKLRHVVFAEEDYGFKPGGDPSANAAALQLAVRDAQVIHLPNSADGVSTFDGTIDIPPHTRLLGAGRQRTRLRCDAPLGFVYQAPKGHEVAGPWFSDFGCGFAGSGIKLNDAAGGFTDTGDSQMAIMRPRLERMYLAGSSERGWVGVEWNKCFDGVIDQCEIRGFGTGYLSTGSDLILIGGRTRIWQCDTLLDIQRSGTFGSGTILHGLDLLKARRCFLRSSDQHLQVIGTYFETSTTNVSDSVLDLAPDYIMIFRDNRFETPAARAPSFMRVRGDANLFVFENNQTGGPAWGVIDWNGGRGARFWKNVVHRQKIVASGNTSTMGPLPFNTVEPSPSRNRYREPWLITPATNGLRGVNYGPECRVREGAFVLPARKSFGSLISFRDSDSPLTERVDVHIQAKAMMNGQKLLIHRYDGSTKMESTAIALTADYRWYTAFTKANVRDLALYLNNDDVAAGGDVLIKEILVERA